jgi:hypothetical protein
LDRTLRLILHIWVVLAYNFNVVILELTIGESCIGRRGETRSDLEVEEVRRRKLEKVVLELLLSKLGGMCYRHNLAGPEGGPRAG